MFLTAQTGFLGPFAFVLGKIFEFIYNLLAGSSDMANLGICIIIFTVIVKLIIFPLSFKQQKSQKINSMLQPEVNKIQKKYKDKKDQESMLKQQKEVQDLYDKYGTSMTGGCLTTFIQLPIIYALYRVIQKIPAYVGHVYNMYQPIAEGVMNVKGKGKAFEFLSDFVTKNLANNNGVKAMLTQLEKLIDKGQEINIDNIVDVLSNFGVSNLQALADNLNLDVVDNINKINDIYTFCGVNISEAPGFKIGLPFIIPVASALFQYLSMKVSMSKQTVGDANSQAMMKSMSVTMPVMSFIICVNLPAFIGIYWATSALVTVLTQLAVNAYYDHIDMDALLAKQMELAAKKKEKNGGKKSLIQRLLENSEAAQEELEKQQAMRKNSSVSLKNYVPSEEAKKAADNRSNKKYKEGSIGSKANIMLRYNQQDKED